MDADAAARPRFRSYVEPVIDADDGLFLFSEGRQAWLPDRIFAMLAPMLDGNHDVETIFEELSEQYPADQVFAALESLRTGGYLAEDTAPIGRPTRAFWEHAGVSPAVAHTRLTQTPVSGVAFGDIDISFLTDLLVRNGASVTPDSGCTIVVTDDYLRPELATWNQQALASRRSWLLVKPVGIETWIGPLFVPDQTACWECLAQRLRGHRKLPEHIARRNGTDSPRAPVAAVPSTQHAVLAEAATQVTRWIGTGGESALLNCVISTNTFTLQRVQHALTRRPQCPACGSFVSDDRVAVKPVQLCTRRKVQTSDGGHRAGDSREVVAQLERHFSPITGIVSTLTPGHRTGRSDGFDRWMTPTFAADHNFSAMHDERFFLREGMRRRSGGKGKCAAQARVSALAESLERYCGVFDGTEPRIRASFAELGSAAIHPNDCMGYSARQYAERQRSNQNGHAAWWVPEPFCERTAIDWTPIWSLITEQTRYLPTSYCFFGYRSADPLFARADSNGCAAGSVLEEAVLQGLLELVERDAVAIWWYNRLRRPGVDLATARDPYVSALMDHYRGLQREIWALDITSDVGVPAFAAFSRRVDQTEEDIIYGFGAHLDPEVALLRALTELNQSLEAVPLSGGPKSAQTYLGSAEAVHWWRTVRVADAAYLTPDSGVSFRRLHDFKNLASDDLYQDIVTCRELAASRDIEILVLDQTRPDVEFPVVRVVAPGLRHFWARFGPGRLYDVPVREGWLLRAHDERELNPFVIQF